MSSTELAASSLDGVSRLNIAMELWDRVEQLREKNANLSTAIQLDQARLQQSQERLYEMRLRHQDLVTSQCQQLQLNLQPEESSVNFSTAAPSSVVPQTAVREVMDLSALKETLEFRISQLRRENEAISARVVRTDNELQPLSHIRSLSYTVKKTRDEFRNAEVRQSVQECGRDVVELRKAVELEKKQLMDEAAWLEAKDEQRQGGTAARSRRVSFATKRRTSAKGKQQGYLLYLRLQKNLRAARWAISAATLSHRKAKETDKSLARKVAQLEDRLQELKREAKPRRGRN